MKIALATPLYPPDIAPPAPYVKELAIRLSEDHQVTIVAYTHIPEEVREVRIVAVSKQQPLFIRLFLYTLALWKEARRADIVYAQNGASVELPLAIVSFLTRTPILLRIGDSKAHEHASRSRIYGAIERFASKRVRAVISDTPLLRPEILPFEDRPIAAFAAFESSWLSHMALLTAHFDHA